MGPILNYLPDPIDESHNGLINTISISNSRLHRPHRIRSVAMLAWLLEYSIYFQFHVRSEPIQKHSLLLPRVPCHHHIIQNEASNCIGFAATTDAWNITARWTGGRRSVEHTQVPIPELSWLLSAEQPTTPAMGILAGSSGKLSPGGGPQAGPDPRRAHRSRTPSSLLGRKKKPTHTDTGLSPDFVDARPTSLTLFDGALVIQNQRLLSFLLAHLTVAHKMHSLGIPIYHTRPAPACATPCVATC
jgi:hypothetical protein